MSGRWTGNQPCSRSWAIAELRRCSGTQFDPDVVDAVVGSLEAGDDAA